MPVHAKRLAKAPTQISPKVGPILMSYSKKCLDEELDEGNPPFAAL